MSRANPTPESGQTVKIKPPSGGPPPSPSASPEGPGRGWVVPVVVIVLVVAAIALIGVAKRVTPRETTTEPTPVPPVEAVAPVAPKPPPEVPVVPETATNLSSATSAPAIKLQGIGYAGAKPWAVVSGKTVYVGDRVGDYRVKEITSSTITLEDASGSLQTLFLHQ